jgi:alpha-amylase/alpha-mannosidase (GH57 family)
MESSASRDPRAHTTNVRGEFRELIEHLREDVKKVEDPKAQALFETAAEVITGLDTAFKHYEEKSEDAWKWRDQASPFSSRTAWADPAVAGRLHTGEGNRRVMTHVEIGLVRMSERIRPASAMLVNGSHHERNTIQRAGKPPDRRYSRAGSRCEAGDGGASILRPYNRARRQGGAR